MTSSEDLIIYIADERNQLRYDILNTRVSRTHTFFSDSFIEWAETNNIEFILSWVHWSRKTSRNICVLNPMVSNSSFHLTRLEFFNIDDVLLFKLTWG